MPPALATMRNHDRDDGHATRSLLTHLSTFRRRNFTLARLLLLLALSIGALLTLSYCSWSLSYRIDDVLLDLPFYDVDDAGFVRLPPPPPELLDRTQLAWWGNVDMAGRSPWDHVPKRRLDGRLRMLFLTDYRDFLERMNSVFYEIVDAAKRHPALEVIDVWGPGWADWDASLSISANLAARVLPPASCSAYHEQDEETWADGQCSTNSWFASEEPVGCGFYDIVWTFSEFRSKDDPLMDHPGCNTVMVHQLGDCHSRITWTWNDEGEFVAQIDHEMDHSCVQHFYPYQGNITVSKYSFEVLEIFNQARLQRLYPGMPMHLFGHSPDTANEWDFYPLDWSRKTEDAVVFGHDGTLYPIRTTVTNAIKEDPPQTPIKWHVAPDWVVSHDEEDFTRNVPPTYWPGIRQYRRQTEIKEDFARGLRRARICVFDSTVERKMIRKYAQAMLSGCVIAADLPTEQEDALREFIIELKPSWDIEAINNAIAQALASPDALRQKAMLGFAYARQHLTNLAKVSGVIGLVDRYRAGERGYDLPLGFSMRCRSFWGDEGSYREPWCQGMRGLES